MPADDLAIGSAPTSAFSCSFDCERTRGQLRSIAASQQILMCGFIYQHARGYDAGAWRGARPVTDFYYDNAPAFRLCPAPNAARNQEGCLGRWADTASERLGVGPKKYLSGVTEVLQLQSARECSSCRARSIFRSQPHAPSSACSTDSMYPHELGD